MLRELYYTKTSTEKFLEKNSDNVHLIKASKINKIDDTFTKNNDSNALITAGCYRTLCHPIYNVC